MGKTILKCQKEKAEKEEEKEEKTKKAICFCERYRNISEEEENKKQKYSRNQHENLPEEEKPLDYRKDCPKMRKNRAILQIKTD